MTAIDDVTGRAPGIRPGVPRTTPAPEPEPAAREIMPGGPVLARVWAQIAPLLPPPPQRRLRHPGRRPVPDRTVLSVVLYVFREDIAWHTAPAAELGCSGVTAWRRMRRWAQAESWPRIREAVLAELDGTARRRALRAFGSAQVAADCTAPGGPRLRTDRRPAPSAGRAPGPRVAATPRPHPAGHTPVPVAVFDAMPEAALVPVPLPLAARSQPPSERAARAAVGDDDAALVAAITTAVARADDAVLRPLLERLAGRADSGIVRRLGESLAVAAAVGPPRSASAFWARQREAASTSVHARCEPETTSPTPTSVNRQSSRN
ncbi:transposase [Streptomyces sp. NPDC047028]|uniref:transposase n=1 Tax=Streptomyces sp. NPDC047028 TaxID=3155793 RepID=UPI0034031401